MMKKIIDLEIIDDLEQSGVSKISLVDVPAIEKYWMAFKEEQFVEPNSGEREDDFIPRCIAYNVEEGKDPEQAAAICYSVWERHSKVEFAKVSFDYDDTLSTDRGEELARREIQRGNDVYIITARGMAGGEIKSVAERLGIPLSNIFATGSNTAKIKKVRDLGITRHYDNNADVISNLGIVGEKFSYDTTALPEYVDEIPNKKQKFESYTDYPEGAVNNAKRALEWKEKNGSDCGTPIGWARANQLANREPISEDTIARMAAFERHRENSDTPYSEGCGGIMWDAWGGDAGVRWAQTKLREIRGEDFAFEDQKVDYSAILHLAKNLGFKAEDFESNGMQVDKETGDKSLDLKFAKGYTVYRYEGSVGADSRDFCQEMVDLGRFYTYEEVAAMGSVAVNPGFGEGGAATYSIWKYKGGPNCKHRWQKYYVNEKGVRENKGAAPGIAGEKPIDMPNQGYAMAAEKMEVQGIILPRGEKVVLQAEDQNYDRGLVVELKDDGGYDVQYWYDNPDNIEPAEVKVDGETITDSGTTIHIGYHPELEAFAASPIQRIPKEERGREGSDKNEPGDTKTSRGGIEVPQDVENTLKDKIEEHNKKNPQDSQKADLGMLKAVWRRGAGAYSVGTPGRRGMTRPQWAMGRVNAFLKILSGSSPSDKDYKQDNDLLPKGHPKHSEQKMSKLLFASEDQQILVGPVAIPDMEIIRKDDDGKPYWVKFSKDVVQRMAEKFMRENKNSATNIQHTPEDASTYVMETWLVENEEDKANSVYDLDVPVGSWVVKMRVTDPEVWKQVKSGKLRGFSLEGNFVDSEDVRQMKEDKERLERIIKILNGI